VCGPAPRGGGTGDRAGAYSTAHLSIGRQPLKGQALYATVSDNSHREHRCVYSVTEQRATRVRHRTRVAQAAVV